MVMINYNYLAQLHYCKSLRMQLYDKQTNQAKNNRFDTPEAKKMTIDNRYYDHPPLRTLIQKTIYDQIRTG